MIIRTNTHTCIHLSLSLSLSLSHTHTHKHTQALKELKAGGTRKTHPDHVVCSINHLLLRRCHLYMTYAPSSSSSAAAASSSSSSSFAAAAASASYASAAAASASSCKSAEMQKFAKDKVSFTQHC